MKMLPETPEVPEPLNLITIIDDCKELIFEYLAWTDLINIADSSKQLNTSVCRVFKRKYGNNARIDFGLQLNDIFCGEHPPPLQEPAICVTHPLLALKILRNFGHMMMNLHIDYMLFSIPTKFEHGTCKFIEQYLAEYCSESLGQLSLQNAERDYFIFEDTEKRFENLKSLHIESCTFGMHLPFNKIFPNLQTLKLDFNRYTHTSAIRVHFPMLKHLFFFDRVLDYGPKKFKEEDIEDLLMLNTQLDTVSLYFYFEYSEDFISRIKEYCPNLQIVDRYKLNKFWPLLGNPYSVFIWKYGHPIFPTNMSDEYKNALEYIYQSYHDQIWTKSTKRRLYALVGQTHSYFLERSLATHQCGGISIREKDTIFFMPTSAEYKLLGDQHQINRSVETRDLHRDFTNDLCAGLVKGLFTKPGIVAVAHTASVNSLMVATYYTKEVIWKNYDCLNIFNGCYTNDTFILPIIENVPGLENEIETALTSTTPAILVRNHGLFVCGGTKEITIKRCEAIESLFEYEVKSRNSKSMCTIL